MKFHEKLHLIDSNHIMSPIDDLRLARDLIARNTRMIADYPTLEDSLKLLKHVIAMELQHQIERNESLREIYES
jgi:hypothetical protein